MFSFLWLLLQSIAFIGAIGSNGSFPKPLSPEEEQKWVRLLIAGDEEAREKLIVHNLRLAAHIAKKYQKADRDREDLISIGTIGLIKAVSTFSESKGTLSAYASRCIENEILMSLRRERKLVETVSIEEPVGADKEGNELRLADLVCTEADTIFEQVQGRLDTVEWAVKKLTPYDPVKRGLFDQRPVADSGAIAAAQASSKESVTIQILGGEWERPVLPKKSKIKLLLRQGARWK